MADTITLVRPAAPTVPDAPARTFQVSLGVPGAAGAAGATGACASSAVVLRRHIDAGPDVLAWIRERAQVPHDVAVVVRDASGGVMARWQLRRATVAIVVDALGGEIDELVLHCECIDVVPPTDASPAEPAFTDRRRAGRAGRAGRAEAGSVGVRRPD